MAMIVIIMFRTLLIIKKLVENATTWKRLKRGTLMQIGRPPSIVMIWCIISCGWMSFIIIFLIGYVGVPFPISEIKSIMWSVWTILVSQVIIVIRVVMGSFKCSEIGIIVAIYVYLLVEVVVILTHWDSTLPLNMLPQLGISVFSWMLRLVRGKNTLILLCHMANSAESQFLLIWLWPAIRNLLWGTNHSLKVT